MEFPEYNFDAMNEADVREEIVAPLIRHLGYRTGTEHDVIREQTLAYDRTQLGRRKPTDPILRGRADYICDAGGLARWVIEAKGPEQPLDAEAEAQAWSYANHGEVRAVYFVLTNGREFKLFVTNRGPAQALLFQCSYAELGAKLLWIENTLRPENVIRDHPDIRIDSGEPLAPGLRSSARITSGRMSISRVMPDALAPIAQLENVITAGSVERRDDGTLYVYYTARSPIQSIQQTNSVLGFGEIELFSPDHAISVDRDNPTKLFGGREIVIPKGIELLNILDWKKNVAPVTMTATVSWEALGYLHGHTFTGTYDSTLFLAGGPKGLHFQLSGTFEANLV